MSSSSLLESIFFATLAKDSPQERAAYLNTACAGDPDLFQRVRRMLDAQSKASSFLEQAAYVPELTADAEVFDDRPGKMIGVYELQEQIGEGGMGTVWRAQQTEPVKRSVALKLIKAGMDSKQVIARFEAERQAMALVDHPNIARVLDAGRESAGRPFFVMDLVHGLSITAYCNEQRLALRDRLELFMPVCQAIQHAHQKGLIHRDIKPSNILVAQHDGKPVPKVIDFGIAKAIEQNLTERTLLTHPGIAVGTLEYMSPEQAEMGAWGIDTRSDIYSLGVLLYELLTGSTPLTRERIKDAGFGEIIRMIKEEDPPHPSTRLNDSGEALAAISAQRRQEPARLTKLVRGELDWIVMKALEKDRSRRYETASAFALDVQRYLADEPVLAGPPSAGYRLRKFVRRNRGVVIAASGLTVVLIAGIIGTTWGMLRALDERNRANAKSRLAEQRADERDRVAQFQARLLSEIDPELMGRRLLEDLRADAKAAMQRARLEPAKIARNLERLDNLLLGVNATTTAVRSIDRNVLTRALDAIERQFADQPLLRAALWQTVANSYRRLGMYDAALLPQQKALETRRASLGDASSDVVESLNNLGLLLHDRGENAEAEPLLRQALDLQRHLLGEGHPELAVSLNNLALVLHARDDDEGAEALFREALKLQRHRPGDDPGAVATTLNNLGDLMRTKGQYAEAEAFFREVLEIRRRRTGDESPEVAVGLNNLALLFYTQGDYAAAEPLYRGALALYRRLLGDEHPQVGTALNNLAVLLRARGDHAAAEPLIREALALQRRLLGHGHPDVATSLDNLASVLENQGKYAAAEPLCREALAIRRRALGNDHSDVATSLVNLAVLLQELGNYDAAEPLYREALALQRRLRGNEHAEVAAILNNLAAMLCMKGDNAAAEPLYREALKILRAKFGNEHVSVASACNNLAMLEYNMGNAAAAEPLLREALVLRRKLLGNEHQDVATSLDNLATVLAERGDIAGAEPLCREALALYRKLLGDTHPEVGSCLNNLAQLLQAKGDDAGAERHYREALAIFRSAFGEDHPLTALALHHLADALRSLGRFDEAVQLTEEALATYRMHPEWHPGEFRHAVSILARTHEDADQLSKAAGALAELVALDRKTPAEGNLMLASSLAQLGSVLLQKRDWADAEPILRESLEIRRKAYPDNHPQVWMRYSAASLLGAALAGQGRFAEAESLVVESADWMSTSPERPAPKSPPAGRGIDRAADAISRAISLYESWHQQEPAAGHDAKVAKWRTALEAHLRKTGR